MRLIKQSGTAQNLTFLMVDSTDHVTPKTGLTPTVTLSKAGGSFASPSGSVSEIGNGWYKVAGNATDTNTLGSLILHATSTGADPTDREYEIVSFDPQDAVRFGLTALPNAAAEASGGLITRGTGTGQLNVSGGLADADAKKINGVSTSSVTTVNANIGTTAVVNFTGSGASALVKVDMIDISSSAVSTSTAQLGVNVVNLGGTGQTGRDIGASVLVGDKTGFALSSAGVQAIWDALTSALTTAGSIGKRIVDYLTGDIFARIGGPAGASVSADIAAVKSDSVAIKLKTDNLPASPAGVSDIPTASAVASAVSAGIISDHGSGSYVRNTEPDNTGIGVAAIAAAAAATNTEDLPSLIEDVSGPRFTEHALEEGPAGSGGGGASAEDIRIEMDDNSTQLAAIKAKTNLITADNITVISPVSIEDNDITVRAGDSWSIPITGLGNISTRTKLWFAAKKSGAADDTSKIFIEETAGLTIVNGAAYTNTANGSITVDDATAGNITIAVDEAVTVLLSKDTEWSVKMLNAAGDTVTLAAGDFAIEKFGIAAIA